MINPYEESMKMVNSKYSDREVKRLLKKAIENVEVPKNLIEECIAESSKNNLELGNILTPSSCIDKFNENREEEERARQIFISLSDSLNKIRGDPPERWESSLREFLLNVKKESTADIMTCYLSQESVLPKKSELKILTQEGTWFPSKMGGLVKRRNIPLLLLAKEPQVFEDAGADYIFSDSDFLKREKVKKVISLPFRSNCQRGIVFLSYRKGSTTQPEISKLLVNNVPRWISDLLDDIETSIQDDFRCDQRRGNRDLVESIKRTAIEGLTDKRMGEMSKALCGWLDLRNVFLSWHEIIEEHEIDKEIRIVRLLYLYSSEEIEKPISYDKIECKLDENQGIVNEAAQSGTYVLVDDIYKKKWLNKYVNLPIKGTYPEIRSELAVPLNRYDGIQVGVLNLESPEKNKFNEDHARQIEKIGQAIVIATEIHNMLNRKLGHFSQNVSQLISMSKRNVTQSLNMLFDAFVLIEQDVYIKTSEKVQIITDMALHIFDASAVDIWQYDHEKQEFSDESALSLSKTFKEKCNKQHLLPEDLKEKFRPRKDGNSQQLMEHTNKLKRIKDATNPSVEHNASPNTISLGIHGLLGVPIAGPQSTCPDGVMWLRFDKSIDFNNDLIETAQKLAGFVHMLWNPLSYHLTIPRLNATEFIPNNFQIGDRVTLTESFMNDDQEYKKDMQGIITGKDAFLYVVLLSDNHRRICVKKESLTHTK